MRTRTRTFSLSALLLLSPSACKSETPADEAKAPPAAEEPSSPSEATAPAARTSEAPKTPPPALSSTMAEHFAHASALEQAVIDGDLEHVAKEARWLVEELPKQRLPEPWQPQLERMQAAAKAALDAKDLVAAAHATGRVVETCGACHAALGAGPKYGAVTAVPEGESGKARMARHQWAAERMREGMIGPSDERWRLGAGAVSEAPPEPCPIADAEILPKEVLQLRETIYEIGAKAAKTEGLAARAEVYGEYLTTCAGCHVGGC
jgi:mono/diheme cytochrome c family protein